MNDAFWSTNRKPLSGETQDIKAVSNEPLTNGDIFAYNHSSDKNMYNGDFSESICGNGDHYNYVKVGTTVFNGR